MPFNILIFGQFGNRYFKLSDNLKSISFVHLMYNGAFWSAKIWSEYFWKEFWFWLPNYLESTHAVCPSFFAEVESDNKFLVNSFDFLIYVDIMYLVKISI